jgi:uncharacterized membrane protein YesL
MPYRAIPSAVRAWWSALITLTVANLAWVILLLPLVTAPPATAAMFALARQTMLRRPLTLPDFLAALGRFFWKSWGLALLSGLGIGIGVANMLFYAQVVGGLAGIAGLLVFAYLLLLWCQAQCYAWAQLAWRPDLTVLQLERNGLVLCARNPLFTFVLTLVLALLLLLCTIVPPLIGLVLAALWASFCVQSLARLVPELLDPEDRARLDALDAADALPSLEQPRGARRR